MYLYLLCIRLADKLIRLARVQLHFIQYTSFWNLHTVCDPPLHGSPADQKQIVLVVLVGAARHSPQRQPGLEYLVTWAHVV